MYLHISIVYTYNLDVEFFEMLIIMENASLN